MHQQLFNIAKIVENRLKVFFSHAVPLPHNNNCSTPVETLLLSQVSSLTLRGGKRLRAALVVCGAQLFENDAISKSCIIDAAAAMELLQTYFLIHDDIMDEDATRRGGPSVHIALSKKVNNDKSGIHLAILAGDLACAFHEGLVANLNVNKNRYKKASQIFAKMHLDVVHGQTLDLLASKDIFEIVKKKTASYTTIGPLSIGAALAGANKKQLSHIAKIGEPMGIGFQLRDDLLGVFGKPETTGKPIGTDLVKGKNTFLLQEALKYSDVKQKKTIQNVLNNANATDIQLSDAIDAMIACGAKDKCQIKIDDLLNDANTLINEASYLPKGKNFLLWIVDKLRQREL